MGRRPFTYTDLDGLIAFTHPPHALSPSSRPPYAPSRIIASAVCTIPYVLISRVRQPRILYLFSRPPNATYCSLHLTVVSLSVLSLVEVYMTFGYLRRVGSRMFLITVWIPCSYSCLGFLSCLNFIRILLIGCSFLYPMFNSFALHSRALKSVKTCVFSRPIVLHDTEFD